MAGLDLKSIAISFFLVLLAPGQLLDGACVHAQIDSLAGDSASDKLLHALSVVDSPVGSRDYSNRGAVRARAGDLAGALEDFEKAIRLDPDNAEAYSGRGYLRVYQGDYRGSLPDFSKSIALDPGYAPAYCGRGQARAELGNEKEALGDFSRAIELDPENAEMYIFRGYHLGRKGEKEKAIADFDLTIRLDPDNALAYCYRGTSREAVKDKRGAIEDYDKVIRFDPDYAWAYYRRGQNRDALGDRNGAIADFNQYIRLLPRDPWGYRARGFTRYEMGDCKGAIADYTGAIALEAHDPWTFSARGCARARVGDTRGAVRDYRVAARLEKRKLLSRIEKREEGSAGQDRICDISRDIRLISDPEIYEYCARTFAAAKMRFGEPRVSIKQLFLFHRPGPGCQTILMDAEKGIFCIFIANKETDDCFYGNLGHEIGHLFNARLCDPYIEGLCSVFGEGAIGGDDRGGRVRRDAFRDLVVGSPFYSETYLMIKEIESAVGPERVASLFDCAEEKPSGWMHINIDRWLAGLPDSERAAAGDIIMKYADSIEKTMPKTGEYFFSRPDRRVRR